MGRLLSVLVCMLLLLPGASAAEAPKYLALTFEDVPPGCVEELLEGLAQRESRATFLYSAQHLKESPAMAQRILSGGHELGLRAFFAGELSQLSRRDMAGELAMTRALLPENAHPRFLRLGKNAAPQPVCQVARATGLALLGWAGDFRNRAARDSSAAGQSSVSRIRDGDVIAIDADSGAEVNAALNTVDILRRQGFRLVTVSELARFRNRRVTAGEYYSRFPLKEP